MIYPLRHLSQNVCDWALFMCATVCLCLEIRRVFRSQIGANGYKWREGNLAAGFVPNQLGPRQRQQGGGQIKKSEENKGGDCTQKWKEIKLNFQGSYTVCHCKTNPEVLSLLSESRVKMRASLLCNMAARITSQN